MPSLSSFSLDSNLFNPELLSRVISLWFSELPLPASAPSPLQVGRWFGYGATAEARAAFDDQCRSVSYDALASVGPDKFILPPFKDVESDRKNYDTIAAPFIALFEGDWDLETSAEKALGLILLFDQLTRNALRSSQGLIYAHYDRIARAVAECAYARGLDGVERFRHQPPYRIWYYYPWMHSESLDDHERLAQNLEEMRGDAEERGDEASLEYLSLIATYQEKHQDVLSTFGRYAHRNEVLGRENTAKEAEYLASGPDTFGAEVR